MRWNRVLIALAVLGVIAWVARYEDTPRPPRTPYQHQKPGPGPDSGKRSNDPGWPYLTNIVCDRFNISNPELWC